MTPFVRGQLVIQVPTAQLSDVTSRTRCRLSPNQGRGGREVDACGEGTCVVVATSPAAGTIAGGLHTD